MVNSNLVLIPKYCALSTAFTLFCCYFKVVLHNSTECITSQVSAESGIELPRKPQRNSGIVKRRMDEQGVILISICQIYLLLNQTVYT